MDILDGMATQKSNLTGVLRRIDGDSVKPLRPDRTTGVNPIDPPLKSSLDFFPSRIHGGLCDYWRQVRDDALKEIIPFEQAVGTNRIRLIGERAKKHEEDKRRNRQPQK